MAAKTIRLDEDVYERLRAEKRDDETFSEAVERLLGRGSLLDLVGLWSDEAVEDAREAIDAADEDAKRDADELVERFEG